ncbi:YncE family protein [Aurantiacibacter flavus]|uniref:ATP-binding protein n=1 Tax=Aurantiacibacter flavus TaxID=3145232 RepID=A0ABV0D0G4_9SPHN
MFTINPAVKTAIAAGLLASVAALPTSATAQTLFGATDIVSKPDVTFSASERGAPVVGGSAVTVKGEGFRPGQSVMLHYGDTTLTPEPLVADADGNIGTTLTLPASATQGIHQIIVYTKEPYSALVAELKVWPQVPVQGGDAFEVTSSHPGNGLYQSAYSEANNALFVAATELGEKISSEIMRLDPETLAVTARATPPAAPDRPGRGGEMMTDLTYAAFGIGVDDTKGTIWITNTFHNTVAVYNQADLSLIKQFPEGTVYHSRDVVIDEELGKAYVTASMTPEVYVFDTGTLELVKVIEIDTPQRGQSAGTASLSLDQAAHKLYVASIPTEEVAVIETQTDTVSKILPVPGGRATIGVSHDPATGRIFVVGRDSDAITIIDGETGAHVATTPFGSYAINVMFDSDSGYAYATARNGEVVGVVDVDGNLVANLGTFPRANHIADGPDGAVFLIDKRGGEAGDMVTRITPAN